jgi:FkbM family methyltransferase
VGELFERFLRDGEQLEVLTRGDFYAPGTATSRLAGPSAAELSEWKALLDAVEDARGQLTMLELGAGFGRWSVYAVAAIRRFRRDLRHRIVAVEAEPTHFQWLRQHTRDNGLGRWSRTGTCRLIEAAVSRASGRESFYIGDPHVWYGQALIRPENSSAEAPAKKVQTVKLSKLLRPLDHVDLIDLDVQGAELEVLTEAASSMGRVRRIHVETHADLIDQELPAVFEQAVGDWQLKIAIPLGDKRSTPLGDADFSGGGVQLWQNAAA